MRTTLLLFTVLALITCQVRAPADNPSQNPLQKAQGGPRPVNIARWSVTTAAFSPDGKYLLLGYCVGPRKDADALELEYLEVASGKRLWAAKGHRRLCPVAILPGNHKALVRDDTTLQLWDLDKGQCLEAVGNFDSLPDIVFADQTGKRCLIQDGRNLRVWDVRQHRAEMTLLLPTRLTWAAFSPDGHYLLFSTVWSSRPNSTLHFWDLDQRLRLKSYPGDQGHGPVAFSPDSKHAVSLLDSGELVVWDLKTRKQVARLKTGLAPIVFTQDGIHLVFRQDVFRQDIGTRSFLQRVEWVANREVWKVELPRNSRHIAISPDGNWAYSDRPVGNPQALEGLERTVWDLKTGKVWRTLAAPSK